MLSAQAHSLHSFLLVTLCYIWLGHSAAFLANGLAAVFFFLPLQFHVKLKAVWKASQALCKMGNVLCPAIVWPDLQQQEEGREETWLAHVLRR